MIYVMPIDHHQHYQFNCSFFIPIQAYITSTLPPNNQLKTENNQSCSNHLIKNHQNVNIII